MFLHSTVIIVHDVFKSMRYIDKMGARGGAVG
jgi:hypothetical protein